MALTSEIVRQILDTIEPDLNECFKGSFRPLDYAPHLEGADLPAAKTFATSDVLVVVPWLLRAVHIGEFLGVPQTLVEVEVRGTTIVQVAEDHPDDTRLWAYYRYIDYLGVLQQLGVMTTTRPALTADEYANWTDNRS
jgi:hypothetical protein